MRLLFALAGLATVTLAGCGGNDRVAVVPARGTIQLKQRDGKTVPMGKARVVFNPVAEATSKAPFPAATANADGAFELGTYDAADGAPAGEYVVTVEWKDRATPKYDVLGHGETATGRDKLKGTYADRAKSSLRATVAAGQEISLIVPEP